jgi:DNA-binding SARP family transcriptional activator
LAVRFRILGPVEVESDDGRVHRLVRRQERMALAVLLIDAGRPVPVDRLIGVLWDDTPPERARGAVHTHIARIRQLLARAGGDRYAAA